MRDDDARVEVFAPVDEERRAVIELLASFVADDGFGLEAAVRDREAGNPLFAFLRENTAEATYYRWRVYALAMGGGPRSTRPARLQTDGVWQGRKRERNSQLQRLRSRPFSTRFG